MEIQVEINPIDTEQNPLETHEYFVKIEDIKEEKLDETPIFKIENPENILTCKSKKSPTYKSESSGGSPAYQNEDSASSESTEITFKTYSKKERKIITLTKVECPICGSKIIKKNVNQHIRLLHPEEANLSFGCKFCDKRFASGGSLSLHMTVKHPKEVATKEPSKFICDYDGKVFESVNGLKGHMQVHMKSKLEKVKCEKCQMEVQQRYLKRHMVEIHTDKNFQCDICSICVKTRRALINHKKGHERKHKCEICKKSFAIQSQLNSHIKLVHEKPQESCVCDVCGKAFPKGSYMETHRRAHKEKVRNFKCDRCPWAFYISSELKKHQKIHEKTDAKVALMADAVKCEKCSKYLKNKKSLTSHMKRVHQGNKESQPGSPTKPKVSKKKSCIEKEKSEDISK